MPLYLPARADLPVRPLHLVDAGNWPALREALPAVARTFAEASAFRPEGGRVLALPGAGGAIEAALFAVSPEDFDEQPFAFARLARLPAGNYRIAGICPEPELAYLGYCLAFYRFDRHKGGKPFEAVWLEPPPGVDAAAIRARAEAVAAGRDLINRPANDLTTDALAGAARDLAAAHGATFREILGAELASGFPLMQAVGGASGQAPRLADLVWGDPDAPKVTLVGKGVVFDTGGLNIKPDSGMLLMRKDMGGAAVALTAARMILEAKLPVRLRLLLPIVENAISGCAFRPGDVYRSRKGLTVEIGNTDAEGRLILADALALADEESPDLLIDFATLTGAARVALGPDLPAFFTVDDDLAAAVDAAARAERDPVWRLPLWKPYRSMLDSRFADLNNVGGGGMAGAVTAALFLARFIENARAHVHFDLFGWTPSARPGRPEGGETQTARLVARLVEEQFVKGNTKS